jgi:EmrB/QacA subfamily drug resistance transporter
VSETKAVGAAAPKIPNVTVAREAWIALAVSTLVTFLVVVDISAVNVAFPSIRDDFDVSDSGLSWVVSGYNITVGALLLVSGRLADSMGRRRVFLPGVFLFGFGSMMCALAPSAGWLIAARLLQGVGGAVVSAAGFAVMLPGFPPARRSTAIGIAGAMGALGSVVGPAVGSFLIDAFSWRAIFTINVPLCLVVLALGPRLLAESRDPNATGRIDLIGVVIGTAAIALVMFAIVQSEAWGIANYRVIGLTIVGLTLLPVVLHRSRTHPEPLINLGLFRFRSFRSATIGTALYGLGFTGGFLANSLMLQDAWDQPIRTVGLALIPSPAIAAAVSIMTGRSADRYGHRWLLGAGCLLCATGYTAYALLLGDEPAILTRFVPLGMITGVGIGLTVATWSSAGLSDIPQANFGVASATYNTMRQAAYGLGVAVVITLIAHGAGDDIATFRPAWAWAAACYLLAGVAVMITFPSGSSHDRGLVTDN